MSPRTQTRIKNIALYALLVNLVVTGVLSPMFHLFGAAPGHDQTSAADYEEAKQTA